MVRPATDANDGRVVAGFPFSGECSIQPAVGKERKEEEQRQVQDHGRGRRPALRLRFDYTVKGGHPADVKRALSRSLADANAELIGDPSITVISRERLPEPDGEDQPATQRSSRGDQRAEDGNPSNSLIVRSRLVRSSAKLVSVRVSHLPIAYSGRFLPRTN